MQKLKVCYNIISNYSCIPPSTFTFHPSPSPRHPHNQIIFMPLIKTSSHKISFFFLVDMIHYWNSLPSSVVSSQPHHPLNHLFFVYPLQFVLVTAHIRTLVLCTCQITLYDIVCLFCLLFFLLSGRLYQLAVCAI